MVMLLLRAERDIGWRVSRSFTCTVESTIRRSLLVLIYVTGGSLDGIVHRKFRFLIIQLHSFSETFLSSFDTFSLLVRVSVFLFVRLR